MTSFDCAADSFLGETVMNRDLPLAVTNPAKLMQAAVLLIEDDKRLGQIIAELLDDNYRVEWALDGHSAQKKMDETNYDAAIVDRHLPDMDGLDLVRGIRALGITTPMLMLTALSSTADIVEGLDGGANDYLTKPFRFEELDARLRTMLRGYRAQQHSYLIGDWIFFEAIETVENPVGERKRLTSSETALLKVMSDNPAHVFTRSELLRAAFRPDAGESTVDAYVSYIRQKTCKELILTVRGRGYILGHPEEGLV